MSSKLPQIPRTAHDGPRPIDGSLILVATRSTGGFVRRVEDEVDLGSLEAGQLDLEIQRHQRLQLDRKDLPVPPGFLGQAVVSQNVGPLFGLAEVRQLNGWHLLDAQQLCGRHAAMARNDLPLVIDQYGIAETELLDALGDLADLLSRMRPRITRIRPERFDR